MVSPFEFHNGVGALGNGGTGHDAPRGARLEMVLPRISCGNITCDGKNRRPLGFEIGCSKGKAVHRGVRESGDGDEGANIGCCNGTNALFQGEFHGIERRAGGLNEGSVLIDRQRGVMAHGVPFPTPLGAHTVLRWFSRLVVQRILRSWCAA